MRLFKRICLLLAFLIPNVADAQNFPTGVFEAVSFEVRRNGKVFSNKDLIMFDSKIDVEKGIKDQIKMTFHTTMQLRKDTPIKKDRRIDKYRVEWDSEKSGRLYNLNKEFAKDRAEFTIESGKLTISAFVFRHQARETQVFRLPFLQ